MLEWISVKERLPEKGERILVTNGASVGEAYMNLQGKWMRFGSELVWMTPTHWMPLPPAPKEAPHE